MNGYEFTLGCPRPTCPGDLAHVNAGNGTPQQAVAIARCVECGREYEVLVRLLPFASPESRRRMSYRAKAMAS